MKKLITGIVLIMFISSCCNRECLQENERRENETYGELLYKTDHCRYYCLQKNGFGTCKVVVCDCDSGYYGNASTSW